MNQTNCVLSCPQFYRTFQCLSAYLYIAWRGSEESWLTAQRVNLCWNFLVIISPLIGLTDDHIRLRREPLTTTRRRSPADDRSLPITALKAFRAAHSPPSQTITGAVFTTNHTKHTRRTPDPSHSYLEIWKSMSSWKS